MSQDVENVMLSLNDKFMRLALKEAKKAYAKGEVPIGAVIVYQGKVIGRGHNERETKQNSLYHAEIIAIQKACKKIGLWRLEDCVIYVTIEPCPMCSGAIIQSRIPYLYYGAKDLKTGCADSVLDLFSYPFHHTVHVTGGVLAEEASALMKDFFVEIRQQKKLIKE